MTRSNAVGDSSGVRLGDVLSESDQTGGFRHILSQAQRGLRLPSVSGAVVVLDRVVWAEAVGIADYETDVAAEVDTQYRMGSITKTFTAVAVLQLRDRGDLDLDDRLGEYLPSVSFPHVTLRQLLAHLGGIQREYPNGVWESLKFPTREALRAALGHLQQVLPRGSHWHYSNLGFALLGEVVASVSGSDYDTYVTQNLLVPLKLKRTTWIPSPPAARGYFIHPFDRGARPEPNVELDALSPAGQLWSTATDAAKWAAFLASPNPGLLSPNSIVEMHLPQTMADPRWTEGVGLGISLIRRGEEIFGAHEGFLAGCRAAAVWSPNEGVGVAVLANSRTAGEVLDVSVELMEATLRGLRGNKRNGPTWRAPGPAPPDVMELLGEWWKEGQPYLFRWEGGLIAERLGGAASVDHAAFTRVNSDRYRTIAGTEQGESLEVVRSREGHVTKLYWATYPLTREPT